VRWRFALLGVLLTALLFSGALKLLGPALGFYYRCEIGVPDARCAEGEADLVKSRRQGSTAWVLFEDAEREGGKRRGERILVHTWKYMLYLSACFFVAPFLLAWRLRRRGFGTAGAAVPLGWLAATISAFVFFGFAVFEGAFLYSMRLHLFALFAWGLAGSLGAALGYKLGYSPAAAMMEALEQ
jgi:hypothetical protein